MKQNKIFVYGTLMMGFRNFDRYLRGKVIEIQPACIRGELYHLGLHDCPAIVDGNDLVYGEVVSFEDDDTCTVLNAIDHFEKYFFGSTDVIYKRTPVQVCYANGNKEWLSYYKLADLKVLETEKATYIPFGDWRVFLQELSKAK